jgi:hypothetical protein
MKLNKQFYPIIFHAFKFITHHNNINKMNKEISNIKAYQELIILFHFSSSH